MKLYMDHIWGLPKVRSTLPLPHQTFLAPARILIKQNNSVIYNPNPDGSQCCHQVYFLQFVKPPAELTQMFSHYHYVSWTVANICTWADNLKFAGCWIRNGDKLSNQCPVFNPPSHHLIPSPFCTAWPPCHQRGTAVERSRRFGCDLRSEKCHQTCHALFLIAGHVWLRQTGMPLKEWHCIAISSQSLEIYNHIWPRGWPCKVLS